MSGERVVILGATRGMGRALARRMAERGDRLFLLGREGDELLRTCQDLSTRARGPVEHGLCDLERPETFEPALAQAQRALGRVDVVVVTAALFATQQALEEDLALLQRLLTVDFTNTILFCEQARRLLSPGGALCVFSSVAGERGRKPVALYGAAKAGLSRYLEALDHQHRAGGLRVLCVKPGFVRTAMTAGLPEPPLAADPDEVADAVLSALDRGAPEVYAPAAYRPVMALIRSLPRFVMRRLSF